MTEAVVSPYGNYVSLGGTKDSSDNDAGRVLIADPATLFQDGFLPSEKDYTQWIFGSLTSTIEVLASQTSPDSGAVDMTHLRRDSGTIVFVVGGTGTCAVTANISRDGVNDKSALAANLFTGITAGVHVVALDDANIDYGHYMDFAVEETGTTNSVTIKAFIMARGG